MPVPYVGKGFFPLDEQLRLQDLHWSAVLAREMVWLIGSGTVESGAKQFKERFTGPGMRWKRSGAEHLLPIRSAIMSGSFHQSWHAIYNLPLN